MQQLTNVRAALQFNKDNGLYSGDADCNLIYFTHGSGRFKGQRDSIKSLPMLDKMITEGVDFTDIEIISYGLAAQCLIPKRAA